MRVWKRTITTQELCINNMEWRPQIVVTTTHTQASAKHWRPMDIVLMHFYFGGGRRQIPPAPCSGSGMLIRVHQFHLQARPANGLRVRGWGTRVPSASWPWPALPHHCDKASQDRVRDSDTCDCTSSHCGCCFMTPRHTPIENTN